MYWLKASIFSHGFTQFPLPEGEGQGEGAKWKMANQIY
jgi:hypothetical protein